MMAFIEQEAKEKVDEIDAKVAEKRSDNLAVNKTCRICSIKQIR